MPYQRNPNTERMKTNSVIKTGENKRKKHDYI